jgi:hypothetical protein
VESTLNLSVKIVKNFLSDMVDIGYYLALLMHCVESIIDALFPHFSLISNELLTSCFRIVTLSLPTYT